MEVSSNSNGSAYDMEEKALKGLLDAFGSVFTLQEIAFAYCTAGRNADLASEYLCEKRTSTSTSTASSCNGEAKGNELLEVSHDNISENQYQANGKYRAPKKKWRPISGGSVSSVIGRDYFKPTQSNNVSCGATKPLKLDASELPMAEIWGDEEAQQKPSKEDHLHKDMEEFLFKMLGEGFQLDRDVIKDVLETCGFDMQKSMEKLLKQSGETADGMAAFRGKSTEKLTGSSSKGPSCETKSQQMNCGGGSRDSSINGGDMPRQLKDKRELQQEVWASLFATPDIYDESELPRKTVRTERKAKPFGTTVTGLPEGFIREYNPIVTDIHIDNDKIAEEDKNSIYQALRKGVVEYRSTMKQYYEAAISAFTKGNHSQANKLLEQGHFFRAKACEADEESNKIIFETRTEETPSEDMELDLHDFGANSAVRLLKSHLLSVSGIPSMKYLKVILEADNIDTSKGTRRKLVLELLEKESIRWIEGQTPGTILVCVEEINPKRLSFFKK